MKPFLGVILSLIIAVQAIASPMLNSLDPRCDPIPEYSSLLTMQAINTPATTFPILAAKSAIGILTLRFFGGLLLLQETLLANGIRAGGWNFISYRAVEILFITSLFGLLSFFSKHSDPADDKAWFIYRFPHEPLEQIDALFAKYSEQQIKKFRRRFSAETQQPSYYHWIRLYGLESGVMFSTFVPDMEEMVFIQNVLEVNGYPVTLEHIRNRKMLLIGFDLENEAPHKKDYDSDRGYEIPALLSPDLAKGIAESSYLSDEDAPEPDIRIRYPRTGLRRKVLQWKIWAQINVRMSNLRHPNLHVGLEESIARRQLAALDEERGRLMARLRERRDEFWQKMELPSVQSQVFPAPGTIVKPGHTLEPLTDVGVLLSEELLSNLGRRVPGEMAKPHVIMMLMGSDRPEVAAAAAYHYLNRKIKPEAILIVGSVTGPTVPVEWRDKGGEAGVFKEILINYGVPENLIYTVTDLDVKNQEDSFEKSTYGNVQRAQIWLENYMRRYTIKPKDVGVVLIQATKMQMRLFLTAKHLFSRLGINVEQLESEPPFVRDMRSPRRDARFIEGQWRDAVDGVREIATLIEYRRQDKIGRENVPSEFIIEAAVATAEMILKNPAIRDEGKEMVGGWLNTIIAYMLIEGNQANDVLKHYQAGEPHVQKVIWDVLENNHHPNVAKSKEYLLTKGLLPPTALSLVIPFFPVAQGVSTASALGDFMQGLVLIALVLVGSVLVIKLVIEPLRRRFQPLSFIPSFLPPSKNLHAIGA